MSMICIYVYNVYMYINKHNKANLVLISICLFNKGPIYTHIYTHIYIPIHYI